MSDTPTILCLARLGLKLSDIFVGNKLIVVKEDGGIDGSWVLHLLLAEFNRATTGRKVNSVAVAILNTQKEAHWNSIAQKFGWNWNQMKECGKLAVIDLLKTTYNYYTALDDTNTNSPSSTATGETGLAKLGYDCAIEVERLTNSCSEPYCEDECLFIIIEDLSHLHACLEENEANVIRFINQLKHFHKRKNVCLCLLVSTQADVFVTHMASNVLSDSIFCLEPLKTGFSPQVDGTIFLTRYERNPCHAVSSPVYGSTFNYKLEERSVRVTPLF